MLSWEDAREKVLSGVAVLPAEERAVRDAMGLCVSEEVRAKRAMPPFDNSAMDGYAVRAEDTRGASEEKPARLNVLAERRAGTMGEARVAPGGAVRIMTGAAIPEGADAVVMVESTNFWNPEAAAARRPRTTNEPVEIREEVPPGANIRRRGESVDEGAVVLDAGRRIGGPELGLLLSVGVNRVVVHPRPRVAVLSTGDELCPPGTEPAPGQIPDSNRPALLALLAEHGFPTEDLGLAGDDEAELSDRILTGAERADFLLTSGGVSVGDYDLTRRVLDRVGDVEAYRVRVKPGKPQLFGRVGNTPVFGLPGNPVSSLVVFDVFVLPALRKMAGYRDFFLPQFIARLAEPITRRRGRVEFMRVRLWVENGVWMVRQAGPQGSGILSSMTRANGYAILPESVDRLETGSAVLCQRWERT